MIVSLLDRRSRRRRRRRRVVIDHGIEIIVEIVIIVTIQPVVVAANGRAVGLHLVPDVLGRHVATGGVAELGRELGPLDAVVLGLDDGEDAAVAAAPERVRGEAAPGRVHAGEDVEPGVVDPVFVAADAGVFGLGGGGAGAGRR